MMKNKKGWIKIAEAFIAVVLIATVVITLYTRQPTRTSNEVIIRTESSLLSEIAQSEDMRTAVLRGSGEDITNIENFIQQRIPGNLNFTIKICVPDDICGIDQYRKEIYADDRIISSTLHEYDPKKLKIFMWEN